MRADRVTDAGKRRTAAAAGGRDARGTSLLRSGATVVAAQAGGLRLGFLLAAAVAVAASVLAAIALPRQQTSRSAPGAADLSLQTQP